MVQTQMDLDHGCHQLVIFLFYYHLIFNWCLCVLLWLENSFCHSLSQILSHVLSTASLSPPSWASPSKWERERERDSSKLLTSREGETFFCYKEILKSINIKNQILLFNSTSTKLARDSNQELPSILHCVHAMFVYLAAFLHKIC